MTENQRLHLKIGGMTCLNCEKRIDAVLRKLPGVVCVSVSFSSGTATIEYRTDSVSAQEIKREIERLHYTVLPENGSSNLARAIGFIAVILALFWLLDHFGVLNLLVPGQLADSKTGYGMLFVIGLFTSVHCVAMCGGINLSQCLPGSDVSSGKGAAFRPALLYNLGRVISYTIVGFILGGVGWFIGGGESLGISFALQGILKLIAGAVMVIMGVNMLGIFPALRRFTLRLPKLKLGNNSPLIIGLFNGLMPCGPLQAMQIVALASGNPLTGALSMFLFSMGTVPLMLGLGSLVAVLGKKFTRTVMTVGAVLVVVLGLAMFSQGWSLSGIQITCCVGGQSQSPANNQSGVTVIDGVQVVNSTLQPGSYPNITVQARMPVKWVITAPDGSINGCNGRLLIREYGLEYSFVPGENVIEFTPERAGRFQYTCWMGMIRGTITVTEGES